MAPPSVLRVLRVANGLSQEALAAQIGVSPSTIARIEQGTQDARRRVRDGLEKTFGKPFSELIAPVAELAQK